MTAKARAALAFELWENLGDVKPANWLSPELRSELHRRDQEMENNLDLGSSWQDIRTRIESLR